MSEKKYLSSLRRGLAALRVLNVEERVLASQLARKIDVPRSTAHRILDTLVAEGYVVHEPHSHTYYLSAEIRHLTIGISRDSLVAETARPILRSLCKSLLTPTGLTTPVGHTVVIQVSLDYEAPLAKARLPEGTSFPVTWGPSGHLYLAHCSAEERHEKIALASVSPNGKRLTDAEIPTDAYLQQVFGQQYAYSNGHNPDGHEGALVTAVYSKGSYIAGLHIRFRKRLLSRQEVITRYLPSMQHAARQIESALAIRAKRVWEIMK